jgi:hypothetical protein
MSSFHIQTELPAQALGAEVRRVTERATGAGMAREQIARIIGLDTARQVLRKGGGLDDAVTLAVGVIAISSRLLGQPADEGWPAIIRDVLTGNTWL